MICFEFICFEFICFELYVPHHQNIYNNSQSYIQHTNYFHMDSFFFFFFFFLKQNIKVLDHLIGLVHLVQHH